MYVMYVYVKFMLYERMLYIHVCMNVCMYYIYVIYIYIYYKIYK